MHEITGRYVQRQADEPAAAGRRRLGQDARGADDYAHRSGQRLSSLSDGTYRNPRRAASADHPRFPAGHGHPGGTPHRHRQGQETQGDTRRTLPRGDIQILIGTHAVIEDPVAFHRLGVAVIDEQHRFGVAQRAQLWAKSENPPHVLVMTATPIPRTLAMTIYGDLDVSVIDAVAAWQKTDSDTA